MKRFILAASLMLPASLVFAQATVSGQNSSTAVTAATIAPGAVAITSIGAGSVKTSEQAPSQSFSSSFSPDSCASGAGGSLGTFNVGLGLTLQISPGYCVDLRVFERLQQAAAAESRPDVKNNARDASFGVLAEISPTIRAIRSEHHLLSGNDAVLSDQSGTVGLQPASTRIEAPRIASGS
jgi:hypothetical protein